MDIIRKIEAPAPAAPAPAAPAPPATSTAPAAPAPSNASDPAAAPVIPFQDADFAEDPFTVTGGEGAAFDSTLDPAWSDPNAPAAPAWADPAAAVDPAGLNAVPTDSMGAEMPGDFAPSVNPWEAPAAPPPAPVAPFDASPAPAGFSGDAAAPAPDSQFASSF